MAVETSARIAILGAGPIGLEAALYARYLGYEVDVYERGRVTEHLQKWGHLRLYTPFGVTASPLGLEALAAQEPGWTPPAAEALLSGGQLAEAYYQPLAQSDLLADSIHLGTEVLAIVRGDLFKGELAGEERASSGFRLLLTAVAPTTAAESIAANAAPTAQPGLQRFATADVVIDATGTFGKHNWLGPGGIPAIGELTAERHIQYGPADVLGRDRAEYAHRHTLLIGSGHSAAATVTALAQLGHEAPYTRVTWVVRRESEAGAGPIRRIADDPWPERDRLAQQANRLVAGEIGHLTLLDGTVVEDVEWHGGPEQFHVGLTGKHAGPLEVDRIIANVGHRPDSRLYAELQVAEDPLDSAPTRWGKSSMAEPRADLHAAEGDDVMLPEARSLLTGEPDFYVLGAKSVGRDSRLTIADGLKQIRLLFTILADRPGLNLYKS